MSILKQSTWKDHRLPSYPKLDADMETDVVIIGGGLAGLLTAYALLRERQRVIVLEAGRIGGGATGLTTAFLTQVIDTDFIDLLSMYGAKNTKLIWQSHGQAIDLIERIVKQEQIDCEFKRCSNYSYAEEDKSFSYLEEEYAVMKKLNFEGIALMKKVDLGFVHHGYIEVKHQAKFHPTKFLAGIAEKITELGGQIFELTEATDVKGKGPVRVSTKIGKRVRAQYAITATYDPLNNPKETFMKKGMYVSYVFELKATSGVYKEGIYEDTQNPYHYFRVDRMNGHDRIIVGGEDNRQEVAFREQKNFNALAKYVKQVFGDHEYEIVRKWRGPILEPSDGLALIGQFKPAQLIAAAFSGNGMTYSAIAAMICKDIITGKKNSWSKLYDPTRTPSIKQLYKKAKDYTEEFIKGAVKNTIIH
jgi:glycine/D-amino acid oxidase-like deaminating enzyme